MCVKQRHILRVKAGGAILSARGLDVVATVDSMVW